MKHVKSKTEHDKLVIETLVRQYGPLSRVQIHELTNLQHSVISRLVRELLDEEKLLPAGRARNPIGRKQSLLRLNEDHGFILGVGFDDESVLSAVMDLRPAVRSEFSEPTRVEGCTDDLVNQLLACAHKAIAASDVDVKSLLGIGVAGSGLIDSREGSLVMSSTIERLRNVPLRRIFEGEFGVPTVVENITRAKTVAERTLGARPMVDDMIYVEYGRTGIGAGVIIGGKLVHGSSCAAGELGHTHMMEDGPACKCGSFGCLEAIAGAAALEARIRKAISDGGSSGALALVGGDLSKLTGWTVLTAAKMGDKTCAAIVEQAATCLGLGLANLVNLFNPAMLVLDQRLSLAGQALLEQTSRVVKRQALSHSTKDLAIRFATLGSEAIVLGVGSLVLEKHFEIPALKPPRFLIESLPVPTRSAAYGATRAVLRHSAV